MFQGAEGVVKEVEGRLHGSKKKVVDLEKRWWSSSRRSPRGRREKRSSLANRWSGRRRRWRSKGVVLTAMRRAL